MATKVYTKTGDKGQTNLVGGEKVDKNHPRLQAYGDVDELNGHVGELLAQVPRIDDLNSVIKQLETIQHRLFNLGSLMACPEDRLGMIPEFSEHWVQDLEKWMDEYSQMLPDLKNFILPGGHPLSAKAHIARTVCRRCERHSVSLLEYDSLATAFQFLNRLSDYFFVLARHLNHTHQVPDVEWSK